MLGRGLVNKVVASFVAAAAAFVAVIAMGATLFYALELVLPPLAAAAITAVVFALIAGGVALVFFGKADDHHDADEEDDAPIGLGGRAYQLFRNRPMLATVATLAGGWIFLRNPALATMVAAAFTEKSHRRYR